MPTAVGRRLGYSRAGTGIAALLPGILASSLLVLRFFFDGVFAENVAGIPNAGSELFSDPAALSYGLVGLAVLIVLMRDVRLVRPLFERPLIYYCLFAMLGWGFSFLFDNWIASTLIMLQFGLLALLASIMIDSAKRHGLAVIDTAQSCLLGAFCIMMLTALIDSVLGGQHTLATAWTADRFAGEIVPLNANVWGASGCLSAVLTFARLPVTRGTVRVFILAMFVLSLLVLLASGSRTSLIACALGLLSAFIFRAKMAGSSVLFLVILALVTAGGLVAIATSTPTVGSALRLEQSDVADFGGRMDVWRWYFFELIRNPFMGHGFAYYRFVEETDLTLSLPILSAHNFFLSAWDATGLLGAALFCAVLVYVERWLVALSLTSTLAGSSRTDEIRQLAGSTLGVFHAVALISMGEGGFAQTYPYFALPLVYSVATAVILRRRSQVRPPRRRRKRGGGQQTRHPPPSRGTKPAALRHASGTGP